jgi:hypothetical protein
MEVKVSCGCGTNYKFDVEPVNKRMPWPVNCPSCGADGTAQANDTIRQQLAANPPAAQPVSIPAARVARPVASAAVVQHSPAPAAIPVAAPIPVARPAFAAPPAAAPPPPPPPPAAPRVFAPAPQVQVEFEKRSGQPAWVTVLILLAVFAVAGFIGYRAVLKIKKFAGVISTITEVSGSAGDEPERKWNLQADNQVVIYLKHTNHLEVRDACQAFFKDKLHRNLRQIRAEQDDGEGTEFIIMPAYNDYVKFTTGIEELKDPDFESLTAHLSQKFNTLAFVEKDVDFSGAFVFGVYEQGTNRFHARLDVAVSGDESADKVTTEGNDWAIAHGYKPGADGFKKFNIKDADDLTKKCGMKVWDQDEESITNYVVLKEWGAKRTNQ